MNQSTTSNDNNPTAQSLFQHSSCSHWGLAVLAWEIEDKRGYQFEDGKLRVFKNSHYGLLKQVDRPLDEAAALLNELNRQLGRHQASKRRGSTYEPIPLAKQVEFFAGLYPKGFQGAKWAKRHRGMDAKRPLKRHRIHGIAKAKELLTASRLEAKLESGEALAVVAELAELMASTDMVTKVQARGLESVDEADAVHLVRALADLLWGEGVVSRRFSVWVSAIKRATGKPANWAVATAIPALFSPHEHVCVKPSTFARQAAWMAPNLVIERQPSGRVYDRVRDMVVIIREKLEEHGLRPSDRLDIYDFIQITLRPKAVAAMADVDDETTTSETAAA